MLKLTFSNEQTRLRAFSLIEMVVTLLITGIIMLALIGVVATILNVSAITHNRARTREDLVSFTQFIERDLRNAFRIGQCGGNLRSSASDSQVANEPFRCEIFTDDYYVWTSCARDPVPLCENNSGICNLNGQTETICKYRLNAAGEITGEELFKLDSLYNVDDFQVTVVGQGNLQNSSVSSIESDQYSQSLVAITTVLSHPNENLRIDNVVRQSLLTTKNYQGVIVNTEETN